MNRFSLAAMVVLLLACAGAHAELVNIGSGSYRDLQFVKASSLESSTFEVSSGAVGINVTLTDLGFPQSFDQLAVAITDAAAAFFSHQLTLGADVSEVSMAIPIDRPGTYVASVYAMLSGQGNLPGVGLYELEITEFVPVPPAFVLLASGLVAAGLGRRRS